MSDKLSNADALVAYLVTPQPDGSDYWLEVGRTYIRADGSCSVRLQRLGLDARLVLAPPKSGDGEP